MKTGNKKKERKIRSIMQKQLCNRAHWQKASFQMSKTHLLDCVSCNNRYTACLGRARRLYFQYGTADCAGNWFIGRSSSNL